MRNDFSSDGLLEKVYWGINMNSFSKTFWNALSKRVPKGSTNLCSWPE